MTQNNSVTPDDTGDHASTSHNGGDMGGDTTKNTDDNTQQNSTNSNGTQNTQDNDGDDQSNTGSTQGDGQKQGFVPSSRLREEADARRELEKKLAEYEKAQQQQEEQEALKRGEHEKVIETYKTKNSEVVSELEQTKTQVQSLKSVVQQYAEAELAKIKDVYGEDTVNKITTLIDSDDPAVILAKLPVVQDMLGTSKSTPTYGKPHQSGDTTPTNDLLKKAETGRLTYKEKQALQTSITENLDW